MKFQFSINGLGLGINATLRTVMFYWWRGSMVDTIRTSRTMFNALGYPIRIIIWLPKITQWAVRWPLRKAGY